MSDRKEYRLGELLIQSVSVQERLLVDQRNGTHLDELYTIKPKGRTSRIWEKDTVAPDMAFPQDVLPTAASKLGDVLNSEAKYTAQSVRTATKPSPIDIQSPDGNNLNGTNLLSSSNPSPPLAVGNLETLSRRDVLSKYVNEKIKKPISVNGSSLTLPNGKRSLPTNFRDQSSNGHMTQSHTSAVERSFMYSTIIDIPPENCHHNPPKLTISSTYTIHSSTDIHKENLCLGTRGDQDLIETTSLNFGGDTSIKNDIDTPLNDAQQGVTFYDQGQLGSISDGRRHPESITRSEKVENQDQGKRLRREAKLNGLHLKTLQSRSLGYEKRSKLRYSRAEMDAAEGDFMRHVREKRVQASPVDSVLEASFERLQTARKEYGSLEESYNEHEERLDREEYNITRIQKRILSVVSLAGDGDSDVSSISGSSEEGSEDLEDMQKPNHPLYEEYLSQLGDLNLCLEEHFNLVVEYDTLLEQQEARQRHGEPIHSQTEIVLAKFPATEAKILERLRENEADVERLRRECIQEGLLGEGRDEEVDSEGEERVILKSPDGSPNFQLSEYQKYSLLLEQPGHKGNKEWSKTLLTRFNQNDIGDRITRWLLHKLRSSCSEVELLARYSEGLGLAVDTKKWQEEVLNFWFIDDANLPASAYQVEPTLTAISSPSLTDLNGVVPTRFGNREYIQLVIRSSSLSRKLEFEIWLRLARMKGKSAMSVS
jgi:hypothetical protein